MKYVGFIKEHDNLPEALPYSEALGIFFHDEKVILSVLDYLNKGIFFFGWMGYVFDLKTNEPIGPDCYYTDGLWIWPSYFPYYIKNNNIYIQSEFLEYLANKNYVFNLPEEFDKNRIEQEFSKKLNNG